MQRATEYSFWELAGEGGGHSNGGEADAILACTKHSIKIGRKHILFSAFCVVMKRQPQPILYKVEEQKKKSPKK